MSDTFVKAHTEWFQLLWECATRVQGFHYSTSPPSGLGSLENGILKKFDHVVGAYKDRGFYSLLEAVEKFSLNDFSTYLNTVGKTYQGMSAIDQFLADWAASHLLLSQLKLLQGLYEDEAAKICMKAFGSTANLRSAKALTKDMAADSGKGSKLLKQIIKLYESSDDKETLLKKGLKITAKLEDLQLVNSMASEIRKFVNCKIVLQDSSGKCHYVIESLAGAPSTSLSDKDVLPKSENKKVEKKLEPKLSASEIKEKKQQLFNKIIRDFIASGDRETIRAVGMEIPAEVEDIPYLEALKDEIEKVVGCSVTIVEKGSPSPKKLVTDSKAEDSSKNSRSATIEAKGVGLKTALSKPAADAEVDKKFLESVDKEKLKEIEVDFEEPKSFRERYFPPTVSLFIHLALILILAVLIVDTKKTEVKEVAVTVQDPHDEIVLSEPEVEVPEDLEMQEVSHEEIAVVTPEVFAADSDAESDVNMETPEAADVDYMDTIESLVVAPVGSGGVGYYGGRSSAGRSAKLGRFGGGKAGQEALIKALEWLKNNQNPDGSWGNSGRHALSGLAGLAFMAYGVTPTSKKYGNTLRKALEWQMNEVDNMAGPHLGRNGYEHAMISFCIAEAAAILRTYELKRAMEKTIKVIVDGQNPDGGYDYDYAGSGSSVLTLTGWNCLALKAASYAGCEDSRLPDTIYKLIDFLKGRQLEKGFCYNEGFLGNNSGGCGIGSARGIGVLCLQIFGEGRCKEVQTVLKAILDEDVGNLSWARCEEPLPLYSWYYLTQAAFNAGGTLWQKWNKKFQDVLVKNQDRTGYWGRPPSSSYSTGLDGLGVKVFNTSLGCLMLTTFYRYLPMYEAGGKEWTKGKKRPSPLEMGDEEYVEEELDLLK